MAKYTYFLTLMLTTAASSSAPTGKLPAPAPAKISPLRSIISADRDTYFPGEAALFTVALRNPNASALEVPSPFSTNNGCLALRRILDNGLLLPLSAHPLCPSRVVDPAAAPITRFAAGEQRQTSWSLDTLTETLAGTANPIDGSVNRPAYYQLEYLYGGAESSVVFRVVAPRLEAATVARLADISYTDPSTGKVVRVPAYAHAFALRSGNRTYICVSQGPNSKDTAVAADSLGNFAGSDFTYVRIAATTEPVTAITASVNADQHIAIQWLDAKGVSTSKTLADYPLQVPTPAIQIGLDSTSERLSAAGNRQFSATLLGTVNPGVKWTVALAPGSPRGAQLGTVNSSGLYSAPALIPRSYTVVLKARSSADETRSATAVISLSTTNSAAVPQLISAAAAKPAP